MAKLVTLGRVGIASPTYPRIAQATSQLDGSREGMKREPLGVHKHMMRCVVERMKSARKAALDVTGLEAANPALAIHFGGQSLDFA